MLLSMKIQALLDRLRREGCSAQLVLAAEEILVDTQTFETRLLTLAQDNISLSDTLQADRSLYQAAFRFERHCQNRHYPE